MQKHNGKTISFELTEMEFQNVKNAAQSYDMSMTQFALHCVKSITKHRIEQLRKEKKDKPLIQLV